MTSCFTSSRLIFYWQFYLIPRSNKVRRNTCEKVVEQIKNVGTEMLISEQNYSHAMISLQSKKGETAVLINILFVLNQLYHIQSNTAITLIGFLVFLSIS